MLRVQKADAGDHSQLSTANSQLYRCLPFSLYCASRTWRWWKISSGNSLPASRSSRARPGAGKSIIIGALQLLLGERTDKSLIRTGAELCAVEAIFAGEELATLNPQLIEAGVEPCAGDLIVKRSFSATGANRQFINGSPTTLAILKKLGDELVDLHGPHDHQSLLSPERQLALLDGFAHAEDALGEYQNHFQRWQTLVAEQAALSTAESAREQELDLLRHQVNEITAANLAATEEEEIESRYKLASNSKRLIELAAAVARRLSEADDSVLAQLAETQRLLRELEKIDGSISQYVAGHETAVLELSEIARSLTAYAEQLDLDPAQLSALEQRVSLFETLKRKYGGSITEVIAFGERAAERMRKIEGRDAELERLGKEIETTRAAMLRAGEALRKMRAPRPRRNYPNKFAKICETSVSGNRSSKRSSPRSTKRARVGSTLWSCFFLRIPANR